MWKKFLVLIVTFMGVLLVCFLESGGDQLRAASTLNNSSSSAISGALSSRFQTRTGSDINPSKTKIYYGLNDKKTGTPIETYELIKTINNYGTLIMPTSGLVKAPFFIGNNNGFLGSTSELIYDKTQITLPEITGYFSDLLTQEERSIAYTDKSETQKLTGIIGESKDDVLFIPSVSEFNNYGTFSLNGKYRYVAELDTVYLPEFKLYGKTGSYPFMNGSTTKRRARLQHADKSAVEYNSPNPLWGACYWLYGVGFTNTPDANINGYGAMSVYNSYAGTKSGDVGVIGFPEDKDQLAGAGNSFGAIRPAALIDLDKIVFGLSPLTSTAKTMTTVDPKGDSALQIRVLDENITITATESGNYGDYTKGKKLEIPYDQATVGENQIISAIITDKSDNIIFYQRFIEANTQTKNSGTITIDTSKFDVADDYHVYLVNENVTDNTRAITSSDLTEKISFNIVPALHGLTYTPARGTTVNNAYQTIEPGHVKVGDSVGSVTSVDGADPITYDIVSADSTQDAPTIFSVINGNVKVNSNANVTAPPGVYEFRVRAYDKFEEPKNDAGTSPVDSKGTAVTGLTNQEGNEVTYGLVTDVITIVVYPHENQLTYTQQRFKGVFHTADKLNNTVTTEVLGKIRISPSARLAQLKTDGYELSSIEAIDDSGNVIPELVISQADSTYSGNYELKKGAGTFISSIDFQLRLTFKNTNINTTSAVLIFDDKGKDYVFRVPGIMGDLEVDEPVYYGDEDKLASLTTEYMNGVPAYFTSTDESIISIKDTDLNDDHSSPLEIHKVGTVGLEVCQTAEAGYTAGDPCPTSAVYGYVEVTVLPREITLKLSDKTIYAGMKFPKYTFESEPVSGTFAYTDTITNFKVPENTSAKDNDTELKDTTTKGTYPITGNYSDVEKEDSFLSNYNVTVTNGTLTIEEDTSNKSSYHLEDKKGNRLEERTWYNHDVNVVIDVVNNDTGTYDQISDHAEFTNDDLTRFKVTEEGNNLKDIYYRINTESESERAGSIVIGNQASIYIDKTEPVMKVIETTQTNTSPLSRMLNSITFGAVSKPGMTVKLQSEDPQKETVNEVSGISELTYQLYKLNEETKEVDTSAAPIEETVEPDPDGTYDFTVNEEGFYKVCATATDKAGNPSSKECKDFTVKLTQEDDSENNGGQTPDEGNGDNNQDQDINDQNKPDENPDDSNGGKDDINNGENPDTDKGDNDQNQGGNEDNKPDDSNNGELPDDGKGDQNENQNPDDTNNDQKKCPDLNIQYINSDGNSVKLNWDLNQDQIPDMNIDSNGDGKADLNIDTDGDDKPDLNLVNLTKEEWTPIMCSSTVKDQKGTVISYSTGTTAKAQINIDLDGNLVPDINIDHKGDFKPHINISKDGKTPSINIAIIHTWKPDQDYTVNGFLYDTMKIDEKKDININIDTDGDGTNSGQMPKPDINIDLDGDGKPDINIDTDGDWIPDINIDGNGDGVPDINIDTDKDGLPDQNIVDITEWKPNINGNKDGTEFGTMEIPIPNSINNASGNDSSHSLNNSSVQSSYNKNSNYGSAIGGVKTGDTININMIFATTFISLFIVIGLVKKKRKA